VGIFVDNAGKGTTSVTLAGNVAGGTGFNAVDVRNGVAAKDLTITAGNAAGKIAGGLNGLNVLNNGKDASTSVSLAGSVAGIVDDGVHVESGADTLNVSVTVKDANGGDEAVEVINRGKGSTTVVASGALVGRDNGLVAANTATGTTLSVTAKDVTGAASGISTNSLGTGATTISVSGKIAGGTGVGISASNAAGTTATINLAATADVSATSGNAILNNGGNSVLNVANGAGLRGTVRLGDGSDTANFALASTEAFIGITALDGGDNLSAADGFVDTLNLNGVGNYDLVGARVTNWEAININAGTVGFSDAIITAGALNVANGTTLNGGNSLVATANVTIAANGTLQAGNAAGNSRTRIVGNLASAGLVNLSGPAGSAKAGDTLAVTGNFTGNGGQVRLDTVLGGDNSPTDLVSITGNAVGGSLLAINNTGGLGGLTTGDGIRVVQVGGTSDRDAFALLGDDVQAGGFRYDLFLGGIADPNDQDWYLRTVGASDIAATTLSFARLSDDIAMTFLGTLHERVGEQEHLAKRGYQSAGTGGLWGRFVGKGFRERLSSATLGDIKSTGSISGLQMGLDFGRSIKSDGSATFTGAYAGYADGSSNDQNIFRNVARRSGSSDSKGWLTGLYATHYGSTGWYANAVVQATWVDASASARNGVTLETDGRTYLGSVELGKSLKLGNRLAFETQAQLIYGETRFDDARDSAGIANKIRIEDSLTGRVGFRLKTTKDEKYNAAGGLFSGYLKANLWHNLLGSDVRLNTAGVDLGKFEPKKTWVDAGLGTTLTVAKNTELFFDADVEIGLDRKTAAGTGKAGLRINW
jgi:outer membrane autotransporter protein